MARFGRSQPPSTNLGRSTARFEGQEPRYLEVGPAGSQERARAVNRAIGEVRTAREADSAPVVTRVRSRAVGVAGESNSAVGIAGRLHRRDVATAGESNSVPVITRKHRRDVGVTVEYDTALPAFDKEYVSDAVFAAAIESTDRQPVMVLRADWNRDGQFDHDLSDLSPIVEQVTVERTLTSMLPAEVGIVEGHASASLKAELSGRWPSLEDMSIGEVFSPYREDSPLYGEPVLQTPVQLDTGFVTPDGERVDRRFTGSVRAVSPRSSSRKVRFEALDPMHRLRRPITLPGVGLMTYLLARYGEQVRERINSQWLIDYILRRNGIYASPPPRPNAVLSITGHGSLIPEIGFGGSPNTIYYTYRGSAYTPDSDGLLRPIGSTYCKWWMTDPLPASAGSGFGLSGRIKLFSSIPSGESQRINFNLTQDESWLFTFGIGEDRRPFFAADGPATAEVRVSPTAWTPPAGQRIIFVGFHVSFAATSMTVRWRLGSEEFTTSASIAARSVSWRPDPEVEAVNGPPMNDWQVWQSATPPTANTPWWGEQWTSQADLDVGANEWTGIPDILAEDSAELIKEIVAAEGSTFWFTESGRPQFRTRKGDETRGTVPVSETVTANKNLADLVVTTDESSIRNIVTLKTQQYTVGEWEDIYVAKDDQQFVLQSGTTAIDIPLEASVYELPRTKRGFGSAGFGLAGVENAAFVFYTTLERWRDATDNPYVANMIRLALVRDDNPVEIPEGNVTLTPEIFIRIVRVNPWLLRIYFTNYESWAVRLATPAHYDSEGLYQPPRPGLIIPGRRIEVQPTQLESYQDDDSIALYGASTFEVGGSSERWKQDPVELREFALRTIETTTHPVPVLDAVDIPHDPRRRLGQRITLADPDGLGSVTATIVGLSTTYSAQGATDRVTVRPIAAPGQ